MFVFSLPLFPVGFWQLIPPLGSIVVFKLKSHFTHKTLAAISY